MVIAARRYALQIRNARQAWEVFEQQIQGDRARRERRSLAEAITADLETWPPGEPLGSAPQTPSVPRAPACQACRPQPSALEPHEYQYRNAIPYTARKKMYDIICLNHTCWLYSDAIVNLGGVPSGPLITPDRNSDEIRGRPTPGQKAFIRFERQRIGNPNAVVLIPGFNSNRKPNLHSIVCMDGDRLDGIHTDIQALADALYEQHETHLKLLAGGREAAGELDDVKQKLMELWVRCRDANSMLETLNGEPSQIVQFGQIKVTDKPTIDVVKAIKPDDIDRVKAELELYRRQTDDEVMRTGTNMLDSWFVQLGQQTITIPVIDGRIIWMDGRP